MFVLRVTYPDEYSVKAITDRAVLISADPSNVKWTMAASVDSLTNNEYDYREMISRRQYHGCTLAAE